MKQSWWLNTRLLEEDQEDNNIMRELVITRQTPLSRRSPIDH
jgi:hypothetical protein